MMEKIRIELFDPNKPEHVHGVQDLHEQQTREINNKIDDIVPKKKGQTGRIISDVQAQQIRREREDFEEKIFRAMQGKRNDTAFCHVAVDRSDPDRPKVLGYIVSHTQFVPPIDQHLTDIRRMIPELMGKRNLELVKALITGEHTYVLPGFRRMGLAHKMVKAHEKEAVKRGYTHRATSWEKGNGGAKTFLEKHGYIMVYDSPDGINHIAAKRLT